MRKGVAGILLSGGATAVLALGLSATTALAATATTYTVSPGGAITAKSGKTTLKDTTTGTSLSCVSSSTKATLKKGSGLAGADLGSITSLTFTTCTGPASLTFTVKTTASKTKPWHLNATSYNATTGVTTGTITGIKATLSGTACSATVGGASATATGKVKVTYNNSTHKLKVLTTGGTLHVWNVSGCLGLINSGDASTFTGTYTVSPAQTITGS